MAVDAAAAALGLTARDEAGAGAGFGAGALRCMTRIRPGDAALLRRLAEWCLRYAPLAAVDPPDGLWIDVTGSTHLHGGETRLLRDLVRTAEVTGFGRPRCHCRHPGCRACGGPVWGGWSGAAGRRMSWPGFRSRHCACRLTCWLICG